MFVIMPFLNKKDVINCTFYVMNYKNKIPIL